MFTCLLLPGKLYQILWMDLQSMAWLIKTSKRSSGVIKIWGSAISCYTTWWTSSWICAKSNSPFWLRRPVRSLFFIVALVDSLLSTLRKIFQVEIYREYWSWRVIQICFRLDGLTQRSRVVHWFYYHRALLSPGTLSQSSALSNSSRCHWGMPSWCGTLPTGPVGRCRRSFGQCRLSSHIPHLNSFALGIRRTPATSWSTSIWFRWPNLEKWSSPHARRIRKLGRCSNLLTASIK